MSLRLICKCRIVVLVAQVAKVVNVISCHAKAPVSDFGAPSGIRNFQETLFAEQLCQFTN